MPSLNEERGDSKFVPKKTLGRTLATRHTLEWLRKERKEYAEVKYPISTVEEDGGELTDRCVDFVMQYIKRAQLLGLETESGRQNLAKAMSTLFGFTETAVYMYGALPTPGVSSGEIQNWQEGPPL